MVALNKILLAADMFVEAHNLFVSGKRDIDYVTSTLLSGAVVGIIAPLVEEQGTESTHKTLANLAHLAKPQTRAIRDGVFRWVYNAMKHAGDMKSGLPASEDLEIVADLRDEAAQMLDAAKSDFRKIKVSDGIRQRLNPDFIDLLKIQGSYIYA